MTKLGRSRIGRLALGRSSATVALTMAFATILTGSTLRSDAPRRYSDVVVVYVGAEDCAPCRAWQRSMGAEFQSSSEFTRVNYREVKAPTPFEILSDEVWPEDLRFYRARIDGTMAVPMWLVIADGQVVTQSFGASQWARTVLPTIRFLVD
jgi:hypothetical protein